MSVIIGLTGYAGCGKDTIADILRDEFGFTKASFAGPLKREVAEAFGLTPGDVTFLEDRETKERPLLRMALEECADPGFIACLLEGAGLSGSQLLTELTARRSYRWVLQRWGTEYRRAQSPTYWIDRAAEVIAGVERVVFTDTRFPNEAEFIRRAGGTLWHIHRPEVSVVEEHVSNQQLAEGDGDTILTNNGTIDSLTRAVIRHMEDKYALDRTGK
jgi:hypothetical protein